MKDRTHSNKGSGYKREGKTLSVLLLPRLAYFLTSLSGLECQHGMAFCCFSFILKEFEHDSRSRFHAKAMSHLTFHRTAVLALHVLLSL